MLQHVPLQVARLREGLLTDGTLVRSSSLVREQVSLEVTWLLEKFSAVYTFMRLNSIVAQDMCYQVVFGCV